MHYVYVHRDLYFDYITIVHLIYVFKYYYPALIASMYFNCYVLFVVLDTCGSIRWLGIRVVYLNNSPYHVKDNGDVPLMLLEYVIIVLNQHRLTFYYLHYVVGILK